MHPDNEPITFGSGTLYLINKETGETTPLCPVHEGTIIKEISIDTSTTDNIVGKTVTDEATFTFTIPTKKLTRKRFIKKLMGHCVPRNAANAVAAVARTRGDPYSWAYMVIGFTSIQLWAESRGLKCEEEENAVT